MKKKITVILLTIALLAGCGTQAPATPPVTDTQDMAAIIRQSVDEVVREKMEEYEEEQRKKDEEIARLKNQLEELTSQPEVPPEEEGGKEPPIPEIQAETTPPQVDVPAPESNPETVSSQPKVPAQPELDPPPAAKPVKTALLNEGTVFEGYEVKVNDWTTPAVSSGGRDWPISTWYFWGPGETVLGSISGKALTAITDKYHAAMNYDPEVDWSIWYAEAFNEYRDLAGEGGTGNEPAESAPGGGYHRLKDALEVIRLANIERENHGLDPLPIDEDLMELARVRAEEIRESYSHTRPDGTNVGAYRCGENCGQRSSASEQVNSWMNSEGHRTNILLNRYHHTGAACYQAENGNLYWVQVFSLD